MTPGLFLDLALAPALRLLPQRMDTPEARAMIVAIALQESKLVRRRQMGDGPARSYLQFEAGETAGISGVLKHRATSALASGICEALDIVASTLVVHRAIEFNDVLACVFGRLLLWTLPNALPGRDDIDGAYLDYIRAWRPGKPRPEDWPANFSRAWTFIDTGAS